MASDFARYIAHLRQSLFDEQLLDEQFHKFEKFETTNEGFLEEICDEYFQESSEFLVLVVPKLFGAVKVTHQINIMKDCLKRGDFEASKAAFEAIKRENELLQSRLESYFKTRKQGPPAEIEDRPEYGYMDSDSE
ncbi:pseudo histidine-containing phosphotransfer protein 2-like isoform X2 [Lycium ferocissimum]|uniref:pseudo histidine-containing phosphotransfer protein 2-like isoform X2 n=1 Tax=Lycium ferocissimum TaxID=112874 RepID=UPI002815E9EF|nr:pseudo histidine-containing phosphotransfer protein 2-like isoform X2 [Lycium ferocissimum]